MILIFSPKLKLKNPINNLRKPLIFPPKIKIKLQIIQIAINYKNSNKIKIILQKLTFFKVKTFNKKEEIKEKPI